MRNKSKIIIIVSLVLAFVILLTIAIVFATKNRSYADNENLTNETNEKLNIEVPIKKQENPEMNLQEIINSNSGDVITEKIVQQEIDIEFKTQYRDNSTLPKGRIQEIQQGQDGRQNAVIKQIYKNGELISEQNISSDVIKPSIDKIVEVGTLEITTNDIPVNTDTINVGFSMLMNQRSNLTLDQFKKIFENENNDRLGVFKDNAEYFYYAEQQYYLNGLFLAAIAIHESGWGTSAIAVDKKNLFGFQAYDSSPYSSAANFSTYAEGIDLVARVLVKYYLNPKETPIYNGEAAVGTYYKGSTISAVNQSYATDKNWGNGIYKWMIYLYNKL